MVGGSRLRSSHLRPRRYRTGRRRTWTKPNRAPPGICPDDTGFRHAQAQPAARRPQRNPLACTFLAGIAGPEPRGANGQLPWNATCTERITGRFCASLHAFCKQINCEKNGAFLEFALIVSETLPLVTKGSEGVSARIRRDACGPQGWQSPLCGPWRHHAGRTSRRHFPHHGSAPGQVNSAGRPAAPPE